jgi:hypothetical protein
MDLVIFEENKPLVLQGLEQGEFDYIDAASEVFSTEFFRHINAGKILQSLAATYPTPRKKQEVPLWFYIASNLSMRLHGVHSFRAYPMVVRAGGMLNAFGPAAGRKVEHPDTQDVTVACNGFNNKNHYDRQTPCDQDTLRKLAKDTDADALMRWFGQDVVREFRKRRAFDQEGIFIGDASYLFVPDNPNYEGSDKLLFDAHNHPVSREAYAKMPDLAKADCQWRRCYKMVTLLHTNRSRDFFLFVGLRIVSGRSHECPLLYELVESFVHSVGKGVMKRLILDRGFLDGQAISRCKREYGIDVLIPIRRNMDIYEEAKLLFQQADVSWQRYEPAPAKPLPEKPPRPRPKAVARREEKRQKTLQELKQSQPPPPPDKTLVETEVGSIGEFRIWSSCTVPLTVTASREYYADGHYEQWFLMDTREGQGPAETRNEYAIRTETEERYRQLKCFCDLANFTSRAFSMVVQQVVFVMLAYDLLQWYLVKKHRREITSKPMPRIRRQLLPTASYTIVYWQNCYGLFSSYELIDIIGSLPDEPRKKIVEKSRRRRRELTESLKNPRSP